MLYIAVFSFEKKINIEFLFHNYPVYWKSSSGTRNNSENI